MTFAAGEITVGGELREGRLENLRVEVRRPQLARALLGLPLEQVASWLPLAFAVCGRAHSAAFGAALAAARSGLVIRARSSDVTDEALREQILSLASAMPGAALRALLGAGTDRDAARAQFERLLGTSCEQLLAGDTPLPLDELLDRASPISRFIEGSRTDWEPAAVEFARLTDGARLLTDPKAPLTPDFAALPELDGGPLEVGAHAREGSHPRVEEFDRHPWLAHWIARLVAVARELGDNAASPLGRVCSTPLAPGVGRAVVETARGPLLYELAVEGTRVDRLVIVAPTEWNFHPRGIAARLLAGVTAGSVTEAVARAQRVAGALDPCVPVRVRIGR